MASVSLPANIRSHRCTARSAPGARHSRKDLAGLWRAHSDRYDFSAKRPPEFNRLTNRATVEGVDLIGNTLPRNGLGLGIELDRFDVRDLLDAHYDLHQQNPYACCVLQAKETSSILRQELAPVGFGEAGQLIDQCGRQVWTARSIGAEDDVVVTHQRGQVL